MIPTCRSVRCLLFGFALAVREIILNNVFGKSNENMRSGDGKFEKRIGIEQAREEKISSIGKSTQGSASKQGQEVEVMREMEAQV